MLKKVLFISFATMSVVAKAQTIVEADLPNLGDVVVEYIDTTNLGMFSPGQSGVGQTWNFNNQFSIDDTSGFLCLSPSTVPWNAASSFPNAEFANFDLQDSTAAFFVSNNTGLYTIGYYLAAANEIGINALPFNNYRLMMPVPFSMNSTRNHTSYSQIDALIPNPLGGAPIPYRVKNYYIQSFIADASGSLTTPTGTYPSAIRIKELAYSMDSTFADIANTGNYTLVDESGPIDSVIYYRWVTNNLPTYRFQLEVTPATNQVVRASFYDNDFVFTNNISNKRNHEIKVYPNPSNNAQQLTFQFNDKSFQSIQIMDAYGKQIYSENINANATIDIEINELPVGIYFYTVQHQNPSLNKTGKFVVTK